MAIYPVLQYPDPRLLTPAQHVTEFGPQIQQLIDDMFETMYHEKGVGLAATQIGVGYQIAVIDATRDGNQPFVIINPEIFNGSGTLTETEGCLSVKGAYGTVKRYSHIQFKALDRFGNAFEQSADGLLAHVVQHETDHLHGKLYIHRLSPLKRQLIENKLKRAR